MTPSITLRGFEEAAISIQNKDPKTPIHFNPHRRFSSGISASEKQKQLNRDSWKVFVRCLIETIGASKFYSICRRYHLDPQNAEAKGLPLLEKHVRLFSIGTARVFKDDIKRSCPQGTRLKSLTRREIQEKWKTTQPFRGILGKYINPLDIYGTPTQLRAWYIHDPVLNDREMQLLLSDTENLTFDAFNERFCKATINRELVENQIIPAPGSDGSLDFYIVHRVIVAKGVLGYALVPAALDTTLKPFLAFRATQMALSRVKAVDSLLEDASQNIAEEGYKAAKPQLKELMSDPDFAPSGTQIVAGGFSLGGTILQRFMADFDKQVCAAYFWNDPSVDAATAERFADKMRNSPRQTPLSVSIYRTEGDFCDKAGEKHLFWNVDDPKVGIDVFKIKHESREVAALSLHSFKIYDTNQYNYRVNRMTSKQEIFNELDNYRRGPEVLWYEKTRRVWGRFLHAFISFSHAIVNGFTKIFGIKILRDNFDP